ncbi:MAG TPA: MFS transporter [Roseiflexaceae bacterium]|nr:MFS transporter [Roseiflexaceae bacterium]
MATTNPARAWRIFILVWCGQTLSLLGTSLTGFGVGVWIFRETGSLTLFALSSFFGIMPGILFMPVAGSLVDRLDRRRVLIGCEAGGLATILALALLYSAGSLAVWHLYLALTILSLLSGLRLPAFQTIITTLVARESLGRASGMVQTGQALAMILSPVLASALLGLIQLSGILLIDLVSHSLSLLIMVLVRLPSYPSERAGRKRAQLLREAGEGWAYIRRQPGLLGLLALVAAVNMITSVVEVLLTPLVLSFASNSDLGIVMSTGGFGMLISSVLFGIWGGPRRRIAGVLVAVLVQGLLLLLAGLQPSIPLLAVAVFLYLASTPVMFGCDQVIWQHKVPLEIQGRVFAIRRMIVWASTPLTFVIAGPLADYLFEPLLRPGGALAGSVGRVIGVGPGRGIALLFILMGLLLVALTLLAALYPRLRRVESELPDAPPAGAPEAEAPATARALT